MDHAPLTPLGARTPHAHPAFAPVIAVLAAAAAVGIYLAVAYLHGWWPLTRTPEPAASASVSPSPSGVPVLYRNGTFGFEVNLPESWRGFTLEDEVLTANRTDGSGQTETFREFHFIHPKSTAKVPRQDIPIMVLTTAQWERIVREELSVGAAPISPSEIGRNSKYVFALPARYNYAFYDGWEEVEAIMKTNPVSSYEPDSSAGPADGPLADGWLPFGSQFFSLLFQVPPEFTISDNPDYIAITKPDALLTRPSMVVERYRVSKAGTEADFRSAFPNAVSSTTTVDGLRFKRLDGSDESGTAALILFDRSSVVLSSGSTVSDMEILEQVLATFRFAK